MYKNQEGENIFYSLQMIKQLTTTLQHVTKNTLIITKS